MAFTKKIIVLTSSTRASSCRIAEDKLIVKINMMKFRISNSE